MQHCTAGIIVYLYIIKFTTQFFHKKKYTLYCLVLTLGLLLKYLEFFFTGSDRVRLIVRTVVMHQAYY